MLPHRGPQVGARDSGVQCGARPAAEPQAELCTAHHDHCRESSVCCCQASGIMHRHWAAAPSTMNHPPMGSDAEGDAQERPKPGWKTPAFVSVLPRPKSRSGRAAMCWYRHRRARAEHHTRGPARTRVPLLPGGSGHLGGVPGSPSAPLSACASRGSRCSSRRSTGRLQTRGAARAAGCAQGPAPPGACPADPAAEPHCGSRRHPSSHHPSATGGAQTHPSPPPLPAPPPRNPRARRAAPAPRLQPPRARQSLPGGPRLRRPAQPCPPLPAPALTCGGQEPREPRGPEPEPLHGAAEAAGNPRCGGRRRREPQPPAQSRPGGPARPRPRPGEHRSRRLRAAQTLRDPRGKQPGRSPLAGSAVVARRGPHSRAQGQRGHGLYLPSATTGLSQSSHIGAAGAPGRGISPRPPPAAPGSRQRLL